MVKGNDFLITSFYSVRRSEEEQCALIREVADICCCIAVKTGPYVACISERVREEADEVGLPILELPEALPYIDIIVNVMNLIFEEEGNSAILEKYVKDILYENYSDRVLMAERGRLFGMDVEHDWFAAVVINFRKMVMPDEQDWKGIRFLARAVLGLFRERTEITECIRIPLKKGYLLLAEGETEDKVRMVLADLFTEEKIPGTLGCRGGPDRLCGPDRSGEVLPGSGILQRMRFRRSGSRESSGRRRVSVSMKKSGHSVRFRSFLNPEGEKHLKKS